MLPLKIIHTADLHLESKMGVNLDNEKAKKRRNELLFTFENLILEAKNMDAKVIIIAGDMFDTRVSIKRLKNIFLIYLKRIVILILFIHQVITMRIISFSVKKSFHLTLKHSEMFGKHIVMMM